MRTSILFRFFALLPLMLSGTNTSLAYEPSTISVYRTCISGGSGEQFHLRYWSPEVNNGPPEQVCVFKTPELSRLTIRAVSVTQTGSGPLVVVELGEAARPLIEKMSQDNVGNLMAIVVRDRIVSMPMITRPYSDNRLLINVASNQEAARIASALNPNSKKKKQ